MSASKLIFYRYSFGGIKMKSIFAFLFIGLFLFGCSESKNEKLQRENSRLKEKVQELEKEKQAELERENRQMKEKIRQLESTGGFADEQTQQSAEQAGGKLVDVLTQLGEQVSTNELEKEYRASMDLIRRIGSSIEAYRTDHAGPPRVDSIYQLMKSGGLVPAYLKIPILQDAWGYDLNYQTRMDGGRRSYWIGSGGSDGSFAGFEQEWDQESTAGADIIYANGEFIMYPLAYK
jgi:hypothetical protein